MKKVILACLLGASRILFAIPDITSFACQDTQTRTHLIRHAWHGMWVGMFLVEGTNGCILIDTALPDAIPNTLLPALEKLKIKPESIKLILNSHSHSDHIDGNGELKKLLPNVAFGAPKTVELPKGVKAKYRLSDGLVISECGATLKVIALPGHSSDSFCFLEPQTGVLFTGDAMQGQGTTNVGLALIANVDQYRSSLHKLKKLVTDGEVKYLALGHNEPPSQNGCVTTTNLVSFLEVSEKTIDDYIAATRELLTTNPKANAKAVRNHLLKTCGSTQTPAWGDLSYQTGRVMYNYIRRKK